MRAAVLWVGHVRTFHRVWPEPTISRVLEPLDAIEADHHFFTAPAGQCRRNRPNDPPEDYSVETALEYVKLSLRPKYFEARDASREAVDVVAQIRAVRPESGPNWVNLEALSHQYIRKTEAWNDFTRLTPDWRSYDVIIFNRPDVILFDTLVPPLELRHDDIHVFTSLGPHKDETGLDDRWALGHPSAMERYMTVGDSIFRQYAVERRPWCPEEVNRRHADRTGLRIVKCSYVGPGWPANVPEWERGHVGIVRFNEDDGESLRQAHRRVSESAVVLDPRRE